MTPGRDVDLEEALAKHSTVCPALPMEANDLLFLLYTSGSTGESFIRNLIRDHRLDTHSSPQMSRVCG